jgi:Holliday junction DNA helicase RuvA
MVGGVGYEILIPGYVMGEIKRSFGVDAEIDLYISYNQTQKQPKPVLVGFTRELDREFFELLITVEDIGPLAAAKAMIRPASEIARYIEERDVEALKRLKGIGGRKAEKIIATLRGKVAKFALMKDVGGAREEPGDFKKEVEDVLVKQLGHTKREAKLMVEEALRRNPRISSSEELFEEIYRGRRR